MKHSVWAAAAALPLLAAGLAAPAFADVVENDVNNGNVTDRATVGVNEVVDYYLDAQRDTGEPTTGAARCNATPEQPVEIDVQPPADSGITASPSTVVFTGCGTAGNGSVPVTFTLTKPGTYVVGHSAPRGGTGRTLSQSADFTFRIDPAPAQEGANRAPQIATQALDATGDEGDTLSTTGSFSDADGDPLTLTQTSGPGTITTSGGSFTWTLGTDDDASGDVVVTATDGESAPVPMTFSYEAVNVAPSVTSSLTQTAACGFSSSSTFTDPGTADSHTTSIDWGDGSTPGTPGVSDTHVYTADGTYTVTVTVTDDDGGAGSDARTVTTKFTAGDFLQPINRDGSSVFKIGSTVPVKIRVTGCAGNDVGTLSPQVNLQQSGSVPASSVNEPVVTESATNGKTMRWSDVDKHYIYNLSTKNSVFANGGALTEGKYTLSVSAAELFAPARVVIGLRK